MMARIWRTRVDARRIGEYERFAIERSLPMFRAQPGFLGVLFLRAAGDCAVITLWKGADAIAALEASPTYLDTVAQITRTGFLTGESSVEVFEVHGGDISAAGALAGDPHADDADP
jgi:heme-degrading monooxygenase HmoA